MRLSYDLDQIAVVAFLSTAYVVLDGGAARNGACACSNRANGGFVAIVSVVRQGDQTPVVLLSPVVQVLPPENPDIRPAAVGGVGHVRIGGHSVVVALPSIRLTAEVRRVCRVTEEIRVSIGGPEFTCVKRLVAKIGINEINHRLIQRRPATHRHDVNELPRYLEHVPV